MAWYGVARNDRHRAAHSGNRRDNGTGQRRRGICGCKGEFLTGTREIQREVTHIDKRLGTRERAAAGVPNILVEHSGRTDRRVGIDASHSNETSRARRPS